MRPIRLRAWDGEQKKMCHKVYVGPEGWHGEYWENGSMVSCFSDDNHPDNALIQFTGLFDKHGKEIWEGDIIRMGTDLGQVEFDEAEFMVTFQEKIDGQRYWALKDCVEPEVLGNIYSNPELLKEKP